VNPAELFRQETDALKVAPGDVLFLEGDRGDKLYVPGTLIGEMALIDDSPRTATVMAKTPSRLAEIDRRRFHFLVQQTPHFATHVMKRWRIACVT